MTPFSIVSFILRLTVCHSKMTLSQWGIQSDMCFSPTKSAYTRITCKHNPIIYNYSINSTAIEEVQAAKYLRHGLHITSKALSVKASLQRNLKSCPTHIKLNVTAL